MTPPADQISWLDQGWFAGQLAGDAWKTLGVAIALGVVLVVISYGFTLVALSPGRRATLCLLRLVFWLGLFLLLAAPTRIERTFGQPTRVRRPLAVLVDRSDSMTALDNRQQRRLDDAVATWKRFEPTALKTFGSVQAFNFAAGMTPVSAPTDPSLLSGGRTEVYASLQNALAHPPPGGWGGVVALTDGVDTSGVEIAEAQRATAHAALTAGTPLFFVVGHNRSIEPAFFHVREFKAPAQTVPQSVVRLEAIFESYQTEPATVPLQLIVDGKEHPAGSIRLEAGRHLTNWSAEGRAEVPGTIRFELRAGAERARTEVRVKRPATNRILYREGKLDWGYRFLTDLLERDDAFRVTPVLEVFRPGIELPPGAIAGMPAPEDLRHFDFIVLADVVSQQLPPAYQTALTRWVSDGGTLLVFLPDDDATRGFAGSELEKILPVVFQALPQASADSAATAIGLRSIPAKAPSLLSFAWQSTSRVREIFARMPEGSLDDLTPKFSTHAHVARAKPGAEVLARHPSEKGPDGQATLLLATQRYSQGRSVVFATDSLWRWKLRHSAENRGPELFWGNFFAWLNRDREPGFSFDHPPLHAPLEQELTFHVIGAPAKSLTVIASLANQTAALSELPASAGSRAFRWRPPTTGFWQIEARDESGETARAWITVDAASKPGELPAAAPDEAGLRSLAAQTGGAILNEVIPSTWNESPSSAQMLTEQRQLLWHSPWIFILLLGVYALELLLRRKWELL